MSEAFVPASELYDVESRTPIAHPAHQATDADVRRALKQREIRTDGGTASSGTERTVGDEEMAVIELGIGIRSRRVNTAHPAVWNLSFPQEQLFLPIGRTRPDESTFAAYADPQRSQTPTTRLDCARSDCAILFTHFLKTASTSLNLAVVVRSSTDSSVRQCRLLHAETERERGDQ